MGGECEDEEAEAIDAEVEKVEDEGETGGDTDGEPDEEGSLLEGPVRVIVTMGMGCGAGMSPFLDEAAEEPKHISRIETKIPTWPVRWGTRVSARAMRRSLRAVASYAGGSLYVVEAYA